MGSWNKKGELPSMDSSLGVEDLQFIILPLEDSMTHYAYMLMDKITSTYGDEITCVIWDIKTYKATLNKLSSYNKILCIGAMKYAPFMPTKEISKDICDGTIIQISGNHAWISPDTNITDYDFWRIYVKWAYKDNPEELKERLKLVDDAFKNGNIASRFVNNAKLAWKNINYEWKELKQRGYGIVDIFKSSDDPNMYVDDGRWAFGILRFFDNHLKTFLKINE